MPEWEEPGGYETDPGGGDIPGVPGTDPGPGGGGSNTPPIGGGGASSGGSIVFVGYEPGNLGARAISYNVRTLLAKALRADSGVNVLRRYNNRYQGARESFKFNHVQQTLMHLSATWLLQLFNRAETALSNLRSVYPTDSEVAAIYHVRYQIAFKEYLLLRDVSVRWFE